MIIFCPYCKTSVDLNIEYSHKCSCEFLTKIQTFKTIPDKRYIRLYKYPFKAEIILTFHNEVYTEITEIFDQIKGWKKTPISFMKNNTVKTAETIIKEMQAYYLLS